VTIIDTVMQTQCDKRSTKHNISEHTGHCEGEGNVQATRQKDMRTDRQTDR